MDRLDRTKLNHVAAGDLVGRTTEQTWQEALKRGFETCGSLEFSKNWWESVTASEVNRATDWLISRFPDEYCIRQGE